MSKISSLNEAIKVLGFNQVKSIIITASTYKVFKSGTHAKIAHTLWEHSLATALGARLIAQKYGVLDMEEAYLCGLLHDIGKLVLLQTVPNIYEKIIEKAKKNNLLFIQVEGQELGFNHTNVGQELLTKWQFPQLLVSQISAHHSTKLTQREYTPSLARVTAIANSMAKYLGFDFFEPYENSNEGVFYIGNKLISDDDIISLRNDTESQFNLEMDSFYE
jgi:putative nucleotidyltransferase with HDIG domain